MEKTKNKVKNSEQKEDSPLQLSPWGIIVEVLIPVLVLAILLPLDDISLKSSAAVSISCSYAVIGSALKVVLLDKAKLWFTSRNALPEFYIGCAVNYSLVAVAVFKLFELVAR